VQVGERGFFSQARTRGVEVAENAVVGILADASNRVGEGHVLFSLPGRTARISSIAEGKEDIKDYCVFLLPEVFGHTGQTCVFDPIGNTPNNLVCNKYVKGVPSIIILNKKT